MGTSARAWFERSYAPLCVLVVGFAVAYAWLSYLRFENFYTSNWDLGINMQMLWSSTHGRLAYESASFETQGTTSFFTIHSTYVALPVSLAYSAFPSATFLFALQAAATASSAIPLYLIGKRSRVPPALLLAGIGVYLVSFPLLSSLLYDFHWESFLSAEFLWTYYLWVGARYRLAMVPAVIGVLTLEVFPFLLLGLVLYAAYPFLRELARHPRNALLLFRARLYSGRFTIGLAVFSVVSYVVLRYVQNNVIPLLTQSSAAPYGTQVSNGLSTFFSVSATHGSLEASFVYWTLLLAAFGFLPLFVRQRLLLVNLPWLFASVLLYPVFSTAFGDQYAFVAIGPLALAFVEGLGQLWTSSVSNPARFPPLAGWVLLLLPFLIVACVASTQLLEGTPFGIELTGLMAIAVGGGALALRLRSRRPTPVPVPSPTVPSHRRLPWSTPAKLPRGAVVVVAFVVVVSSNVVMSPLYPSNFGASGLPGYFFSTSGNPVFGYMPKVLDHIPANAVIVASDDLFPFVANDVHAYSLYWYPYTPPDLPFNRSNLPTYVLISSSQLLDVPAFLASDLFNPLVYGVVVTVYDQPYADSRIAAYPGSIYLLSTEYRGPTAIYQANPFPATTLVCPDQLYSGSAGTYVGLTGAPCGSTLKSELLPYPGYLPGIWEGPYLNLVPGSYLVTFSLEGGAYSGTSPNAPVVLLEGGALGLGSSWFIGNVTAAELSSSAWTGFSFRFSIAQPVAGAEFPGTLAYSGTSTSSTPNGHVTLGSIEVRLI